MVISVEPVFRLFQLRKYASDGIDLHITHRYLTLLRLSLQKLVQSSATGWLKLAQFRGFTAELATLIFTHRTIARLKFFFDLKKLLRGDCDIIHFSQSLLIFDGKSVELPPASTAYKRLLCFNRWLIFRLNEKRLE